MRRPLRHLLSLLAITIAAPLHSSAARADVAITFTSPEVDVVRGAHGIVTATITNVSLERVYLNGVVNDLTADVAADTSSDAFLANAPAFLEPGEAWQGLLLSLDVALASDVGDRVIAVHIIGGADEAAGDDVALNWFRLSILPTAGVAVSGPPVALALEGARPNPARGDGMDVAFALPSSSKARLELLDLGGRRVAARDVGALGAGRHTVRLAPAQKLAAGLYWVRLTQGEEERVVRVTVLN